MRTEIDLKVLDKDDIDELCDLYEITMDLDCVSKLSIKDEILELTLDWEDIDELLLKIISIPKFRKFVETELNSDTIVRFPMVEDELDKIITRQQEDVNKLKDLKKCLQFLKISKEGFR